MRKPTPDVVGIGALNADLILPGPSPDGLLDRIGAVLARPLPPGSEHALDADEMRRVLAEIGSLDPQTVLGGSAWNTVYALAHLGTTSLGYVGVAGRTPPGAAPIADQLDRAGVDRRYVTLDDAALCGTCVSLQPSGERILLTHVGANAGMAGFLDAAAGGLVTYLAGARAVHVTSFLDPDTPGRLADLLHAVKRANPDVLISLDPGHVWATGPTDAIHALVTLADVVLLNDGEFTALASRHDPTEPDGAAAGRLLDRGAGLVVVKRADGVRTFRRAADGSVAATVQPTRRLPASRIRDDTGAGDVFAAGLLAGVLSGAGVAAGVELGMALARHTLQHVGTDGHDGFGALAGTTGRAGSGVR